ncbi:hypothetical protein [Streptomyces sp. CBMA156]|uniref:hypothetical protein n=1 Tax=Streptomyces sp. CBMA156 TaxID=1930280 RepID=UPI001661A3C1|nr:hypothetical protein [Streptomyces sp. CBMA156]MBD0674242.1 hypothetical protein [Streptomyces sp. CBMA156]
MTPLPKRRRTVSTAGFAALLAIAGLALSAAPAQADPPPRATCNPEIEQIWDDIVTATVTPVVTEFTSFNVVPGTTGQQQQRLTQVTAITTKINNSADFNLSYSSTLQQVSTKTGFQVETSRANTRTTDTSRTVNINAPGNYGIFRGFLRVDGEWARYLCARSGKGTGYWINASPSGTGYYTTYGAPSEGVVLCSYPEPAGTVREAARLELCKH